MSLGCALRLLGVISRPTTVGSNDLERPAWQGCCEELYVLCTLYVYTADELLVLCSVIDNKDWTNVLLSRTCYSQGSIKRLTSTC